MDQTGLKFENFEFAKAEDAYGVTIVRLTAGETVVQVDVAITATASADFSLYIWDNIDPEELGMGGTSASSDEVFNASVLITLAGNINGPPAELEVVEVEVIEGLESVDMGEIEIDYGGDDDDYGQLQ